MQNNTATTETTLNNTAAKLLRADEICKILGGIGRSTLLRMARQKRIPCFIVGNTGVRFDLEEVRAALRRPARTAP